MATSVGAAAAQGLESGFGLGLRMQQAEEDKRAREQARTEREQDRATAAEERTYQRGRQEAADSRLAAADRRQARVDELSMLDREAADLQNEGSALWSQYGGYEKVPEDVRGQYVSRVSDLRNRRNAARQAASADLMERQRKEAAETWSRVQTGQRPVDSLSPGELYRTLTVQARRPAQDFLRPAPGQPSPVEQAALDVEAGVETGNTDLAIKGANVLLRPELMKGIGEAGPDGSEIIDKSIYSLVPHPNNPGMIVPILEVKVRRADGAIGSYRAPVTVGRGGYFSDPNAMPQAISLEAAMKRVYEMRTAAEWANSPDVRAKLEQGATGPDKKTADDFLAALGYAGVKAPEKPQVKREHTDLGNVVLEREVDATGRVLSERKLPKGAAPRSVEATADARDAARHERDLREAVRSGLLTQQEADDARRRKLLGTKPAVEDKPLTESQAKANLFGKRMLASEDIIDRIGTNYSAAGINAKMSAEEAPVIGGLAGMAGNMMLSDNSQQVEQAQRDFINAVLRRESGAMISPAEFKNGRKQYFPQPGDSEAVIAQKAANRKQAIEGMFDELPPNRRPTRGGGGSWDGPSAPKTAAQLPPQAASQLKEGHVTTFKNGQRWTLRNGQPEQVQ